MSRFLVPSTALSADAYGSWLNTPLWDAGLLCATLPENSNHNYIINDPGYIDAYTKSQVADYDYVCLR